MAEENQALGSELLGPRRLLHEVETRPRVEQILEHPDRGRKWVAMPRSRPAAPEEVITESAPLSRSRWTFWASAHRRDDRRLAVQLPGSEGDEDRGVIAVGRNHDRPSPLDAGLAKDVFARRASTDGGKTVGIGPLDRVRASIGAAQPSSASLGGSRMSGRYCRSACAASTGFGSMPT